MLLKFRIRKGLIPDKYVFTLYGIITYFKSTTPYVENEWYVFHHFYNKVKVNYPNLRKTFKELKFRHEH